jgi:hypothetical protein
MDADRTASVLVVSLGGLGDFITRWPLWQSLRRSFPRAEIAYLGHLRHACLLRAAGLCDAALNYDAPRWAAPERCPRGFDVVISALGARGAAWAERLKTAAGASRLLSLEPFPPGGGRVSVGAHIDAQRASAGLADPGPLRCGLSAGSRAWAAAWRESRGLSGAETVALHPGSGAEGKNWPRASYEALASSLAGSGMRVLVFAGEAERERGEGAWPDIPGVVHGSGFDLTQTAALLSGCRRYVGNDSGVSHLAALLGVPSTVIFGPTDPLVWAPRGGCVRVVTGRATCAPCGTERMRECPDRLCLAGIRVEKIIESTRSMRERDTANRRTGASVNRRR